MKHTPGPWKALGLLHPFGYVIKYDQKDGKEAISYIQAYDIETEDAEPFGEWGEEAKANHDLVLAAPDLLEALVWVMRSGRIDYDFRIKGQNEVWCNGVDKVKAAIKKATGE